MMTYLFSLEIIYLIASVTYIVGLKMLGHPETARKGNLIAAFGMTLAILGTIFLFEGEVQHRDSVGSVQVISPGDVGFMTSGKGVAHTERTPPSFRDGNTHRMHGYQVWVALPKEKEEMEPRFDFISKDDLPNWNEGNLDMTLVAGEAYGRKSPLPVFPAV